MDDNTKTPAAVEGDGKETNITVDNAFHLPYKVITTLNEIIKDGLPETQLAAIKELRWWIAATSGISPSKERVHIVKHIKESYGYSWVPIIISAISLLLVIAKEFL